MYTAFLGNPTPSHGHLRIDTSTTSFQRLVENLPPSPFTHTFIYPFILSESIKLNVQDPSFGKPPLGASGCWALEELPGLAQVAGALLGSLPGSSGESGILIPGPQPLLVTQPTSNQELRDHPSNASIP